MIRTVFLDLDDTILDFERAEEIALEVALRAVGVDPTPELVRRYREINIRHWQMLERREITRAELLPRRFAVLFAEFGISADPQTTQDIYEERLSEGHFFIPGAEELLDALTGKYRLFITSNGNKKVQDGRLASANISHYFEGIFVSEVIGYDKPSREYFREVFDRIGNPDPRECVIIGDSLSSDIRGGLENGMHTIWFNFRHRAPREDIVPEYVTDTLADIPSLIEKL